MAKTKEQKKKILEDLKEKIARQKTMIFVDFKGLKVKELSDLRKKLKLADCNFSVVKKTLLNLIFKEKNVKINTREIEGQLALVFGFGDEIAPAKIVYDFWQEHKTPQILGGFFENKFRPAEEMIILAKLPSREQLLAQLVRTVKAPISNLRYVLEANIRNLVYIFSQIKPST